MPLPAVVLMGPTGAGKTALGIQLAKEYNGEIISADSRQVYLGMDVGTDKPGSRQSAVGSRDDPITIAGVPHFLIDILTPDQQYSAAAFRDDARRIIADMHRRGKLPIVVGGTGFYIRALTGERALPNVAPDQAFRAWAERQAVDALAAELRRLSPTIFAKVDNLKNRRRVTRYLEVARGLQSRREGTEPHDGILRSFHSLRMTGKDTDFGFRLFKVALVPRPDVLRQRLSARVDAMFRRGFVDEVRRLLRQYGPDAPGLQTTGYREIIRGVETGASDEALRETVFRAHWETARRQLTWLKREPSLARVADANAAGKIVRAFLAASE